MRFDVPALALLLLAVAPPNGVTTQMASHIDAAVSDALLRQHVAAASVAIVENGNVVYAKGYGVRDIASGAKADAQTVYPIGSNTKQFTAAAILLLQEQGRLDIQDRLAKFVPDAPHANELTIQQLLEQVSGLPDYTQTGAYSKEFSEAATPDQALTTIRDTPLAFKPGTSWQYSNSNYLLLSIVIAKASGESYQSFIKNHLLKPLGLKTAAFDSHERMHADEARGYTSFAMGSLHDPRHEDYSWFQGAGDLMMSAVDLARWDIALDAGNVVSPVLFAQMSTPKRLADGKSTGYGYGLSAGRPILGHPVVGHLGGLAGFISADLTIPSDHVAIVLLGNSDSFDPVPLTHDILATIYGQALPHHAPKVLRETPAENTQAHLWLQRALSGEIESSNVTPAFARWLIPTPAARQSVVSDLQALGKRLGTPERLDLISRDGPPGVTAFSYRVTFAHDVTEFDYALGPSGKLDYLNFAPAYDY